MGAANAQVAFEGTNPRFKIDFNAFDANRDSGLTEDELRTHTVLTAQFRMLDVNADGRLSTEELRNWL